MFRSTNNALTRLTLLTGLCAALLWTGGTACAASGATESVTAEALNALGRQPTPAEIAAWDIDVRADFKGLPPGRGSAEDGIDIWEDQCASCHGIFGESNQVFTPLVGGTTDEDVERGVVASLSDGTHPHRTTIMRLSQMSTLWDYINRAMPWNNPKSLKPDETYAVIAYLLNLADLVEPDFVLSDKNIAEVQARLPNRNGMKKYNPMWEVDGKPDVQGDTCMSNCDTELNIRSFIPDYARNAHGNLAQQNRAFGATRGVDTTKPAPHSLDESRKMAANQQQGDPQTAPAATGNTPSPAAPNPEQAEIAALAKESGCLACHGLDKKILGPGFKQVAARYKDQDGAAALLAERVLKGASGTWGAIPMPANSMVNDEQAKSLVKWILGM